MRLPKIVSGMLLYTIGSFIPKAINFVLLPIYTHFLMPSDIGIIGALQSVSIIIAIVLTLGFERGIYRLFHDYPDPAEKKVFIGTVSSTVGIASTLLMGVFIASPDMWTFLFREIRFHPYILLTIISAYLGTFSMVPMILLQVEEKPGKFLFVSVTYTLLKVVLSILMITVMEKGVVGILEAEILANIIMIPYYLKLTFQNGGFSFDKKVFKNCASFSIPFLPGLLSSWALNMSARIFIERTNSLAGVGVYTISEKIADLMMLVIIGFSRAYNPVFFRIINSSKASAPKLLGGVNHVFLVFVIFVGYTLCVWRKLIISLFGPGYSQAEVILPAILLAMVIGQMGSILNNQIYQAKRSGVMSFIVLISALGSVILNSFFVQKFGPIGAAYTLICVNISIFLVEYPIAQRLQFVEYHFAAIVFALVSGIALLILNDVFSNGGVWWQILVNLGFTAAGGAWLAYLSRETVIDVMANKSALH